MKISTITVAGLGLIGGSFCLAIKQSGFAGRIIGVDSPEALQQAGSVGAIDIAEQRLEAAVSKSQLVVLAAPVRANIALLEACSRGLPDGALITDVGSTKVEITLAAESIFGTRSLMRFLPGHPMAGSELSGVLNSDATLFAGRSWVLTPRGGRNALAAPEFSRGIHAEFMEMLEFIGARTVITTPERHDRLLAYSSHLPQVLSTALSAVVMDAVADDRALPELSGRALRDMLRLAQSDARVWSDIAASNRANLSEALERFEREIRKLRNALGTPEFESEFNRARAFNVDTPAANADDTEPPIF